MQDLGKYKLVSPIAMRNSRNWQQIQISHGTKWIVFGQMKNPFNFSLTGEYVPIKGSLIPGEELLKKLGESQLASGILSQKYFSQGGYLVLPVEMRIIEGQYEQNEKRFLNSNVSKVVTYVRNLANMLVPDAGFSSLGEASERLGGKVKRGLETTKDVLFGEAPIDALGSGIRKIFNERTVSVRIGSNFLCDGLVLTSLNATYSREKTKKGPLFVDLNLSFESIQTLNRGNDMFSVNNVFKNDTQSRVKLLRNTELQ